MSDIGRINPFGNLNSGSVKPSSDLLTTTVQVGESKLSEIAGRLKCALQELMEANPHIADPNSLQPGQDICLPSTRGDASPAGPFPAEVPIDNGRAGVASDGMGGSDSVERSLVLLQFKKKGAAAPVNTLKAKASVSTGDMKKKVDDYFDKSNTEYTLPDGSKVNTEPQFRMNSRDSSNRDTGQVFQEQLTRVLKPKPTDRALQRAIHMTAYGRATPDQIKLVTQALIDKGGVAAVKQQWKDKGEAAFKAQYPNTDWPLSDADAIKLLQWSMGVGVDCAGYVQQEFLAVHGGSRADYGFKGIGEENLSSLTGNGHFDRVGPEDAKPGDLMILDRPAGETVGHTVMVQDRHSLTDAERASYPGIDAFAKRGEKVQVFVVEGSFGSGGAGDPARGGVQRRVFFYNESTKKWADMRRDWDQKSSPTVHISSDTGPYDHPMNGIFHPNGK